MNLERIVHKKKTNASSKFKQFDTFKDHPRVHTVSQVSQETFCKPITRCIPSHLDFAVIYKRISPQNSL